MKAMLRRIVWCGTMVALAACLAPAGRAAYLESDQGGPGVEPPPPPPPPYRVPPPPRYESTSIAQLLVRVDVGSPVSYRGLAIYPLYLRYGGGCGGDIRSLDEAARRGWLRIEERDQASVPWLRVRNESGSHVLLMTGEILVGGRQNRVIRDDVLLPPYSGYIDVAVYCGERERWTPGPAKFESGSTLAHPRLRAQAAAGADQGAIWTEIEEQSRRAEVSSPTHDYQRVYEDRRVRGLLDDYVAHCRRPPRASVVGLVAVSGGRILGADLFGDAGLLNTYWDKLVRSYGMDAAYVGEGRWYAADAAVRRYLAEAAGGRYTRESTAGAGELWRISGGTDGVGLEWDGRPVHVHLLAGYGGDVPPPPPPEPYPPIRPMPHMWR